MEHLNQEPRRDELIIQIGECARELAQAVDVACTQEWLRLELTMAQLKAVFVLAATAPVTMGTLAKRLGTHLSAASHIADRLVRLKLVERSEDQEDRRRTLIRLAPAGSTLVEQLRQGRRDQLHSWLAALDDGELVALHHGLRALIGAIATDQNSLPT